MNGGIGHVLVLKTICTEAPIGFHTNEVGCLVVLGLRVHHNTKWVGNGLKLNWGKFLECW